MNEIFECEVCSNTELQSVLNLGEHPLPDDLRIVGTEPLSPTYPVEVLWCDKCHTAHQRFQVSKHKLFPPNYHYRARQTDDVLEGMHQLVAAVEKYNGSVRGLKVLDIGCNDGSLLDIFRARGAQTYGIEPTDAAIEGRASGHSVIQAFLDQHEANRFVVLHGHPDVITFTNVFAHIEDLRRLLRAVCTLVDKNTLVVIENHYLGSVIERHQFDTFYHEHPRTYSLTSFQFIAEDLGMHIDDVSFPARYGGNIRVFLRDGVEGARPKLKSQMEYEGSFGTALVKLNQQVKEWRQNKRIDLLVEHKAYGPLVGVAFPGRAAILMRLLGLPDDMWDGVYEKPGSRKIGYYVPGTHISIKNDDLYPAEKAPRDAPIINLAWHIPAEVATRWRKKGFRGRIVPIVHPTDFE
jgi:SAM-dependent methyltransferase